MDLAEVNEMISTYIRPQTFPFAVRFCESLDEVPGGARIPHESLRMQIPICQAVGMVRRYGWTIALTPEDMSCPYGALALGFVRPKAGFLDGSYADSMSPGSGQRARISAGDAARLEFGKYAAVLLSPLHSATFQPHLIVIYGNSAQVMRLVQGTLHGQGGYLTSRASGGMDCSDLFAQPIETGEAQVILPCNGDRVFGMTQDDEMAFSLPAALVDRTMEGLKASHNTGQRYPTPSNLRFKAQLPPAYYQLMDYLNAED
ncbi:MAG: DUF169 domain-containing protein [Dehalococcoidia bacterium]|nr:DUF169 domain-containing protein [Dehalococcoidia bacterium]